MRRSLFLLPALTLVAGITALVGGTATNAAPAPNGLLRHSAPIAVLKAGQSTNWFGYNQGALEPGKSLFHSITANWTVPTATEHKKGEDESSATWAGIGGGCLDSSCLVGDNTLIQAGAEQDIVSGTAQYSAWWEVIPAPSITITMTLTPGDRMHLDIHEIVPNSELWSITLSDVSRNETFNQTVPYPSTYGSAEWVNETPLLIGTNAGFSALPTLSPTTFDQATANGVNPHLTPAEEIQLVTQNGTVYGAPSAPDGDTDGGAVCAWATSCSTPSS
ncbi:MAG: hypothetical protein JO050_05280 [Acidimicrobiia bacterium]|nr:hypothetical protein [Acidimicrobiia bacterium]